MATFRIPGSGLGSEDRIGLSREGKTPWVGRGGSSLNFASELADRIDREARPEAVRGA
jgi:hypothetical protein